MKKISVNIIIVSYVLITTMALASCKKDSKNTVTIEGNTWTSGTPTITTMVGTKTLEQYYTDIVGLTAAQALQYSSVVNLAIIQSFTGGTIQFKTDNTYTATLGGTPDTGKWSLSADGKKLTIDSDTADPQTADITELTANKLTVSLIDTESEDLNSDGIPETITVNITFPFTR